MVERQLNKQHPEVSVSGVSYLGLLSTCKK